MRLRELEAHPPRRAGAHLPPAARASRWPRSAASRAASTTRSSRAGRHGPLLVEHRPGQRAGGERDRQPPRPGRREVHHRAPEPARPRLRPRQRRATCCSCCSCCARAFFAPIHGEARHQRAHAELAAGVGHRRGRHLHPGQRRRPRGHGARGAAVADRVHAGLTYVDQAGRGRRHRERAARPPPPLRRRPGAGGRPRDASDGSPVGEVEIVTRGFGRPTTRSSSRRPAWRWSAASPRPRPSSASPRSACSSTSSTTPWPRCSTGAPASGPMVLPVVVEV